MANYKMKENGFQLVEKSKNFFHKTPSGTSVYISGVTDKKAAKAAVEYVHDIYEWNKTGRPIRANIDQMIQSYWENMPKVNEFLVKLKQLPAAENKTLRDVVDIWARQNEATLSTIKDKIEAVDIFEDILGSSKSLSRFAKKDVQEVFRSCATGKHSLTTRKGSDGRLKSESTRKKLLTSINVLLGTAFKQGLVDIDLRQDVRTFLGKRYSVASEVRQKKYISVEEYEHWYTTFDKKPDYQLLITFMRFLGCRPYETFMYDTWEDLEWNNDATKDFPVAINRHVVKRKNRDRSVPTVRVVLPKRVIAEIVKYRDRLKNWEKDYPKLFSYKNKLRPPLFDDVNNTFHGNIFCVRTDVNQILKDADNMGLNLPNAFFTCLRASASANIFDFGGSAMENKMLDHNEQTRLKHYSRSDLQGGPLADRPESFAINGGGKDFYEMYDEFIQKGEDYYSDVDVGAAHLEKLKINGYE